MLLATFIIHLERSWQRQPQVERLQSLIPMQAEVVSAIDGQRLDDSAFHRVYRRNLHAPRYPFLLSRAEAACFLSHREAWQRIVDRRLDAGLIIEDDVDFTTDDWASVITRVLETIEPGEVIRFPMVGRMRGESGPVVRQCDGIRLTEPRLPGRGMLMQVVGAEAARRLLAASNSFDRPVDSFLQMQWLHGARVLSAQPSVARHIDFLLGGTVLHNKHQNLVERARREVQRPLLRLAIYSQNERWRRRAA